MRIICENGFYKFFADEVGEIRRFSIKYGVELVQCEDYFTFPILAGLANYSFKGQPYGGLLATVNFAGKREEVMAANGYAYYQPTQTLILNSLISKPSSYSFSNFFYSATLPQAYSYDSIGRISGFSGFCDVDFMRFKIERFFYENI